MAPFIAALLKAGLSLTANAALAKGTEWVKEKTGIDLGSAGMTPEQLTQLKQFELEHEAELAKLKIEDNRIDAELEKAYLADVSSARSMQIAALGQEDSFSKRFIYYFAIGWSVFGMVYILLITFAPLPETAVRFADTILGFLLGTLIATLINFFYGSSRMSRVKDDNQQQLMTTVKELMVQVKEGKK